MLSEPFVEATPQVHVLIALLFINPKITFQLDPWLFWATFSSSVIAATLGIAKFLKTGPCRLFSEQGPLGGYGTLGFLVLMLNIASTIVSKGFMLPAIGAGSGFGGKPLLPSNSDIHNRIIVWIFVCYVPQILYVSKLVTLFCITTIEIINFRFALIFRD